MEAATGQAVAAATVQVAAATAMGPMAVATEPLAVEVAMAVALGGMVAAGVDMAVAVEPSLARSASSVARQATGQGTAQTSAPERRGEFVLDFMSLLSAAFPMC